MDSSPRDRTRELATFLAELEYEQLPRKVVDHAKSCILNAVGCALGSSDCKPRQVACETFLTGEVLQGAKVARVLGRPERTDAQTAAFLNGIAFTAADYDDTHLRTVVHPSATPLAAILAWAEVHRLTGKEVILAFVAGVEAQCAVGNAISPSHYKAGWHVTGTTGTFGAAAGMAKLLHLPANQFADALGHGASMASGIRAMFGTDTKTLHAGRGAQNGIIAANLARNGFASCASPIEAWARLVSTTINEEAVSAVANGGPWQILENTFKPYPCGIVIHPAIDAALEMFEHNLRGNRLHDQAGPESLEDIASIEAVVTPQCVRLCNVRHPRTGLETIFSLYHGIAVSLVHGRAGPAEFSDAVANDPTVARIRDMVVVKTDGSLRDDEAWLYFSSISKQTAGQRDTAHHIMHATGSLDKPMRQDQLEKKYLEQASKCVGPEKAQAALEMSKRLDLIEDIGQFVDLLAT